MASDAKSRHAKPAAYAILLFPFLVFQAACMSTAHAACTTTGQSTICDSSAPNPTTSTIGNGNVASEDNRTVTVQNGSSVAVGDENAISVRDNANVTVQSGGTVSATGVSSSGLYGTGADTIEFANNGQLTVQQNGQVLSLGTETSAEAVNLEGSGNTIVNDGLIRADHAAAIWFQNLSGTNTIINNATGVIQAPGDVIGASGNGAVDFTNRGQVIGNLVFAGGDDTLRLYTGSTITGNMDGGGGTNTVYLNGTGTASLPGNFTNFQTLYKADSGTWSLTGTITGVTRAEVQGGTLALTGNNSNYTGTVIVDPAGTLQARAQSLPPSVLDNGLVRFAQPDAGTYTGALSGTGAVEKTGQGTLTLAPSGANGNTYSGGTTISQGTLAIGADAAIGAASGALVLNGGTLQANQNLSLAPTRAVSITSANGTIDTQGFTIQLGQGISGAGALTKAGSGTLVLSGANTYTGGTTVSAGTLQLGNGGTSGSIVGNVTDNSTLAFDRSDATLFSGTVSGSGSLAQTGSGTTVLSAANAYTGGTTISAGTLQLGNGGTSGSIVGNVSDNGTLVFDRSDATTFSGTVSGSGALVQAGSGTTVLDAANTYSGTTTVSAGALAVGDSAHASASLGTGATQVAAGATLGGYGSAPGSVINLGTLAVASAMPAFAGNTSGTFTIGGDLSNTGLLQVGAVAGQTGNTLNVRGNYVGASGTLAINTVLNQGGAATQTDTLVIGGNASGTTGIQVQGTGSGAQTVGDGIRVVQVGGTSASGAFHLASPVQAGAYQYLLYQGGATPSDWYLRSKLLAQPGGGSGSTPGSSSPANSDPATAPTAYRPAVVGYSLTPLLNADYGFSILSRLHERVGDIAAIERAQPAHRDGVWARVAGQNLTMNGNDRFSAQARTYFAQFGKDWTLAHDDAGGSTHTGAMVTLGTASSTFDDSQRAINAALTSRAGSLTMQAQSIGGYWTRYLPDGTYFDGVAQLTHYHDKYSDVYGGGATQNGLGAGVSAEAGKPLRLGVSSLAIEPQMQLLYQYVHLNPFSDSVSAVSGNTSNELRGRIGFRLFRPNLSNDAKTGYLTPYFTADILRDFISPGQVVVGDTSFAESPAKTWYELGVGATASMGKASMLYVNLKYTHNLGGERRRSVFGQVGYRYSW
ncbi:MAG: autotransporter outer membrane beta-barrel domain-containing protein [Pandoraea sp.]|nr:MAG: autotransporter outer membrane beta-barrel domain-containing protein [Pandoraea sp.]TAM18209.1 MAG: autotransporter outer membrane beta-barrel domain-containing protein [Pandoraea sp.]